MNINNDAILLKMAENSMSRQALAEKSGIKYGTLVDGMRRGHMPTESIGKIAKALNCEAREIVII